MYYNNKRNICERCDGDGWIHTAYESFECVDCLGSGEYTDPNYVAKVLHGMSAGIENTLKTSDRTEHKTNQLQSRCNHEWMNCVDRGDHGTGREYRSCKNCGELE